MLGGVPATPTHWQIYEGMRRATLYGALRPDQRVPLARDVCRSRGHRGPGYAGARIAMQSNGTIPVSVSSESKGQTFDEFKCVSARGRAIYVTPSHRFPLGVSMTAARRRAL